jgi:predicted outer membrane repeat protein
MNGGSGGAIYLSTYSSIQSCLNCQFVDNEADKGGGVYLTDNSIFSDCLNCLFENNIAFEKGGAVYLEE